MRFGMGLRPDGRLIVERKENAGGGIGGLDPIDKLILINGRRIRIGMKRERREFEREFRPESGLQVIRAALADITVAALQL
jgi:hypothetical protein